MLTQRLGSSTQKDPVFIDSLIEQIKRNPGSVDEVWFATDYGFPSMETHRESAILLAETAEKFRKIGVRVSLQLSNSIGHGEYISSRDCTGLVYPGSPAENMVGHDGAVAGYCFCWNGQHLREYVNQQLHEYVSRIKPYCVWIDDDLRASNHYPVSFGCFCEGCMNKFNERYGSSFTREELVREITTGDLEWRKRHIEFLRDSLGEFTYEMGVVIHKAYPDAKMGYQYCANGGYTGFGYDFIYDAMKRATHQNPCSRPGGGAYDDYHIHNFIDKAELLDYQNYMLPEYVEEIRPEIESLPDIVYGKSIGGTCFETSYYLASGANAMSYAMLMNDYEPMEWHGKMLAAFSSHRKFWEKLSETSTNSYPSGLALALPHAAYLKKAESIDDYSGEFFRDAQQLRYINIPVAYSDDPSLCTYLSYNNAMGFTDEELAQLMTRAVVTTADVVALLQSRGFSLPCTVKPIDTLRLHEEFTSHIVNAGRPDGTAKIWRGQFGVSEGKALFGEAPLFEALGYYRAQSKVTIEEGAASAAILTLDTGAKWAVFSFDFPQRKLSFAKVRQLTAAINYITPKPLPAELLTAIQGALHVRVDNEGRTTRVCFTNCTFGDSGELELLIRNPKSASFRFMGQYEDEYAPQYEQISDNEYKVRIKNVRNYAVGAVFCD